MKEGCSSRFGRTVTGALDICFLISLVAMPVIWLAAPFSPTIRLGPLNLAVTWGVRTLLIPVGLIVGRYFLKFILSRMGMLSMGLLDRLFFKKLCMAVAAPFIALLFAEQGLELVGYEGVFASIVVQGETTTPYGMESFVDDPELLWKLKPGTEFRGMRVNSLGFRDREVSLDQAENMARVICIGDSCTADGMPPYSATLHNLLVDAPPDGRSWEAFNAACYGYSSVQGLRSFRRIEKLLKPDVVTVYFGWNDHLISGHGPDSGSAVALSKMHALAMEVLRRKRFGQFLVQWFSPALKTSVKVRMGDGDEIYDRLRVPPSDYNETLTALVSDIRAIGAIPILMTAPSGPFPQELVSRGSARSLEEFGALHQEYVEMTRHVARDTDADLLDLEEMMSDAESKALFTADGIHLNQQGLDKIAELLHKKLSNLDIR